MVTGASGQTVRAHEVTWVVRDESSGIDQLKATLDRKVYRKYKQAIKDFLCGYFSSGECRHRLGKSISPVGATRSGGKILKVRWALPGRGKSGGLRLVVVAYCEERKVVIADAFDRKADPSKADIEASVAELP